MTREEAIESLERVRELSGLKGCRENIAINMAIEALSQPERPKGRWILEAHKEKANYRWNVTAECSECCEEPREIWAGFFPNVPDCIAKEVALNCAKSIKTNNFCPNCGSDNRGEEE